MPELMVFENPAFGQVRTITREGEPWFVAADVCRALCIANNREALSRLDNDEKGVSLTDTLGGKQEMATVNEPGLYTLIMGSRKKEAKAFRRWIAHEVIPSIRKHGLYATEEAVEKMLGDPDFLITTLTKLKDERQRRKKLEGQLLEEKPYTDFAKSIAASSDSIHVGDFAKLVCNSGINIGRTRLFRWLRENGYLTEDNKPYQRYIDQGLFTVKEYCVRTVRGDMIRFTTLVTGKGQMAMLEMLRDEFGLVDGLMNNEYDAPCFPEGVE